MSIDVTFWGVRGSVPTPLTPKQLQAKVQEALRLTKEGLPVPFEVGSTYGGNTTCVEVQADGELFILDMGTGVRELGKAQMAEVFQTKKLRGTILQSHVHWDHIQGLPFWGPMYLPRSGFDCAFNFFGGKQWDSQLDTVYRGQMNPPVFPVNLEELEQTAMQMEFQSVYDGWQKAFKIASPDSDFSFAPQQSKHVKVLARKLFHPQETFGYRITIQSGESIAFTTDHEPYADGLPKALLELVDGADLWITDCQYTHDQYLGAGGPQRMGWGHSFPEYIARVAKEAKPKAVITTHHDPDSSDQRILEIANAVADMSGIQTIPAYEGLMSATS